MSIATVITEGYGSFGSIPFVILDGYSIGGPAPPPAVETYQGTKGQKLDRNLWEPEKSFEEQNRDDILAILLMMD